MKQFVLAQVDPEAAAAHALEMAEEWGPSSWKPTENTGDVAFVSQENFGRFAESHDSMLFIFFSAPWCGHCEDARKGFAAASKMSQYGFAVVDCDANPDLKARFKVKEYPTFVVVKGDLETYDIAGTALDKYTTSDFRSYMRNMGLYQTQEVTGPLYETGLWGGDESGAVQFVGDETFETYRYDTQDFLAMFYAPWCGHCKTAKPEFALASSASDIPMTAVDCTGTGEHTCRSLNVNGFPSFMYFHNGIPSKYQGARTWDAFVDYADSHSGN